MFQRSQVAGITPQLRVAGDAPNIAGDAELFGQAVPGLARAPFRIAPLPNNWTRAFAFSTSLATVLVHALSDDSLLATFRHFRMGAYTASFSAHQVVDALFTFG